MLISSLIYSCELAHSHSQNGILLLCISRTEETSSTPVLGGVVSRYSSHEKDLKKVMREILYFLCSRSLPFQNIDGNTAQSASVPLSSPHHGCIEYMHSSSAFASTCADETRGISLPFSQDASLEPTETQYANEITTVESFRLPTGCIHPTQLDCISFKEAFQI